MIYAGFPFRGLYLSIRAAGSGSHLSHNAQLEMMKLKSNQTRTYDGDGYKKRAACLCFRSEAEQEVSTSTGAGETNGPPGGRARASRLSTRQLVHLKRFSGVLSAVSVGLVSGVGLTLTTRLAIINEARDSVTA